MFSAIPPLQTAIPEQFVDIGNNHALLAYWRKILSQFMYANNFGLALDDNDTQENKPIFLENLFVAPHLAKQFMEPEFLIAAEQQHRQPKWLGISKSLRDYPRLFLLGNPGAGKSTLINWLMLACTASANNAVKIALGQVVPFSFILRELPLQNIRGWDDLWQAYLSANPDLSEPLQADPSTVAQVFESGQAIFMLDGLDEITHPALRKQLGQAVLEGMKRYPRCRYIMTSRLVGFEQRTWFGFPEPDETTAVAHDKQPVLPMLYLAPFNKDQVGQFARNWYQQYVPKDATTAQRIQDLSERIAHNDGLGRLARIPVLLNMICFIHARRGRLPDGRAELYQRIAETYLIGLDQARGLQDFQGRKITFDYHDLREWLGQLALQMQKNRTEENNSILLTSSKVKAVLHQGLSEKGMENTEAEQEANFILAYLSQRSGLFLPRGKNKDNEEQYAFSHLSFMEYFAAGELRIQAQFWKDKDWNKLRAHCRKAWWEETLVLFFEQLDHSRLTARYVEKLFGTAEKNGCLLVKNKREPQAWSTLTSIIMDTAIRIPTVSRKAWIRLIWDYYLHYPRYYFFHQSIFDKIIASLWTQLFDALTIFQEQAQSAQVVRLSGHQITDLRPLAQLSQLQELDIGNTSVSDLKPLVQLNKLQILNLANTSVSDLRPLAQLSQLQELDISNTSVSDLRPLIKLGQLKRLIINDTHATNIRTLKQKKLEIFKITNV